MRFTPLTSFNSYITNDIVRFWIPFLKGFWDPYKSYIEIQVEVDQADFPYGTGIQVDNSASSFISQLTLFVDSKQIQRIQQYDTIAALLHDLMYMPSDKFGKDYEGFGYAQHSSLGSNVDTRRSIINSTARGMRPVNTQLFGTGAGIGALGSTNMAYDTNSFYACGYHPQRPIYITPKPVAYPVLNMLAVQTSTADDLTMNSNAGVLAGGYRYARVPVQQSVSNSSQVLAIFGGGSVDAAQHTAYNMFIRAHPHAFQFLFLFAQSQYLPFYLSTIGVAAPFAQTNVACARPWVQSHCQSTMYGVQSTQSNNFTLYPSAGYAQHSFSSGILTNVANVQMSPNYDVSTVKSNGYSQAFSQELTNSSYEPLFTPAHPQTWIHNGAFLTNNPVKTRK